MGLRPGRCYRELKDRAYTRIAITVPSKNFVGANPALHVRQFNMGNPRRDFSHILDLIVEGSVQIRDNALEAARIAINRYLHNKLGKENYFMRIRVYPYQILREHKLAQGAGADRVSKGMSHAFGKPIGRAVRVRKGQVVISVLVDEEHIPLAREALMRAKAKFPCKVRVRVHTDIDSIGTRPRFVKEEVEEEKKEEEGAVEEKKEEAQKEGKKEGTEKQAEEKK
jgi:large subunit ribosomal protein L10e